MARVNELLFFRMFDLYDNENTHITSFFDQLDLTQYSALTIIQAVAADNVDAYIKSSFSRRYLISDWCKYISWDKDTQHFIIDTSFYDDFSKALCAALTSAEAFFKLSELDFMEAPEVIEIERAYAEDHTKTERGDDINMSDAYDDYREDDIKQRHSKTENDIKQRHTKTEPDIKQRQTTTENTVSAFNSSGWENANKSVVTEAAYKDAIDVTEDAHKDAIDVTDDAHKDKITSHGDKRKVTSKFGDLDVTRDERTDTETTTKTGVLSRDKYFEILKELAEVNAYKIIGDAIISTLLRPDFDSYMDHAGFWFPV